MKRSITRNSPNENDAMKSLWNCLADDGLVQMRRPKDKNVSIFRVFVETASNTMFEIYSRMTDLAERVEIGSVDISLFKSTATQLNASAFFGDHDSRWSTNLRLSRLKIFECGSWHVCGVKLVRPSDGAYLAFVPADCPFGVAVVSSEQGEFGRTEYDFDLYQEEVF